MISGILFDVTIFSPLITLAQGCFSSSIIKRLEASLTDKLSDFIVHYRGRSAARCASSQAIKTIASCRTNLMYRRASTALTEDDVGEEFLQQAYQNHNPTSSAADQRKGQPRQSGSTSDCNDVITTRRGTHRGCSHVIRQYGASVQHSVRRRNVVQHRVLTLDDNFRNIQRHTDTDGALGNCQERRSRSSSIRTA
jgi:hypothetical protein